VCIHADYGGAALLCGDSEEGIRGVVAGGDKAEEVYLNGDILLLKVSAETAVMTAEYLPVPLKCKQVWVSNVLVFSRFHACYYGIDVPLQYFLAVCGTSHIIAEGFRLDEVLSHYHIVQRIAFKESLLRFHEGRKIL
jgi:hypothetical protein